MRILITETIEDEIPTFLPKEFNERPPVLELSELFCEADIPYNEEELKTLAFLSESQIKASTLDSNREKDVTEKTRKQPALRDVVSALMLKSVRAFSCFSFVGCQSPHKAVQHPLKSTRWGTRSGCL